MISLRRGESTEPKPAHLKRTEQLVRFLRLWCKILLALLAVGGAEACLFGLRGIDYRPKSSLSRAWASQVSIDANGSTAAARVTFVPHSQQGGSWNDIVLVDLKRRDACCLGVQDIQPQCVAIAPDGRSLAIGCPQGRIYAVAGIRKPGMEAAGGEEREFARCGDEFLFQLVFSPDGRRLAALGDRTVSVWDWPQGTLLQQRPHDGTIHRALSFLADSQRILSPDSDGGLCIWDCRTGAVLGVIESSGAHIVNTTLSDDSRLAAIVTQKPPRISMHRLETNSEVWHEDYSSPATAFDDRGRWIACAVYDRGGSRIVIRDAECGGVRYRLDGKAAFVVGVAFSADGLLYSWDLGGTIRAWNVAEEREQWSLSLLDWAAAK